MSSVCHITLVLSWTLLEVCHAAGTRVISFHLFHFSTAFPFLFTTKWKLYYTPPYSWLWLAVLHQASLTKPSTLLPSLFHFRLSSIEGQWKAFCDLSFILYTFLTIPHVLNSLRLIRMALNALIACQAPFVFIPSILVLIESNHLSWPNSN